MNDRHGNPWIARGASELLVLAILLLAGCATSSSQEQTAAPPGHETQAHESEAEVSDLDRAAEELLAASCEHGILQHACDECRYEVGVAKVDPSLLGRDGLIDTVRVATRPILAGRDLNGEVRLDPQTSVEIAPRVAGIVRSIHVDIGDRVRAGELLFEIESAEVSEARAAYLRARAARRLAEITAAREEELFEKKICPRKDLLEAQAAHEEATASEAAAAERLRTLGFDDVAAENASGRESARLPVRAPIAGVVLERRLGLGATVTPGEKVLLLGDPARIWVTANLYERDLAMLQGRLAGETIDAEVTVPSCPGKIFRGRLDRLSGTLDDATRTVSARIIVDNEDNLLRSGMFAKVRLLLDSGARARAVPQESVLEDAGRSFVFTRITPPYYLRRSVTVGRSWPGWVEIEAGLAAGDVVVARGSFLLKSDVLRSKMGAGCAD